MSDHFGTLSIKDLRVIIHVNLGSEAASRPFLKKNYSCFHGQGNIDHQNNKFNNKRLDIDHRNHPSEIVCIMMFPLD